MSCWNRVAENKKGVGARGNPIMQPPLMAPWLIGHVEDGVPVWSVWIGDSQSEAIQRQLLRNPSTEFHNQRPGVTGFNASGHPVYLCEKHPSTPLNWDWDRDAPTVGTVRFYCPECEPKARPLPLAIPRSPMQFMTVQEAAEIYATVEDKADTAAICADCHRAPLRIARDPEKLKDVLTQVAATHGPAKTEGSEIRDNVAKLNNQFEDYARRALPALDVMRMALVKMTGGSEDSLRRDYEKGMRLDTQQQARRKYGWRLDAYQQEMNTLQDKGVGMQTMGPDGDRYRALKRQQHLMRQQQLNFVEQGNANAHAAAYGPQTAGEAALDSNYISSPSAAAAGSGAAGNWAGNNVGNVKDVNGNWRRFPSQQAGVAASAGQLLRYSTGAFKGGRKRTLREIVSTYASGDPEVPRYIRQASEWTGYGPDQQLDLTDQNTLLNVTRAILRKENVKNASIPQSVVTEGVNMALNNQNNYKIAPETMPAGQRGGKIDISDANINVNLQYPDGRTQTQSVPVKSSFTQPRSFASR